MTRQPGLFEAISKLAEAGPLALDVINPMVRLSREAIERDPDRANLYIRAFRRFLDEIEGDHRPRCLLCRSVRWTADIERNPVRPAAIAVLSAVPEFRNDADGPPAFHASGICATCTANKATLRERTLDAYRKVFPTMKAFTVSEVAPMPSSRN